MEHSPINLALNGWSIANLTLNKLAFFNIILTQPQPMTVQNIGYSKENNSLATKMITGLSHTLLIILITILTSIAAWQHRNIMNRLIFNISAIKHGQYDRFLTHGFIHNDGVPPSFL